jgi:adenylate kinase family enzyme
MNRVLVVGTTGTGKTTTAAALARVCGVPHVELDSLFWNPGWVEAETEVFRERVAAATAGDRWVADGNYLSRLGDTLWNRADTVVWLDPSLALILVRLVRRTVSRSLRGTELWSGNRERLSNLWNKDESLVSWALKTHTTHRVRYTERMTDPKWAHISFVRLGSAREVRRWLSRVSRATRVPPR